MAILNRIVNILILLLVIAAGVFSFMLFQKRESLTQGMKDMAVAISNTAKTLDKDSGTNSANSITPANLHHTKDFKKELALLNETAAKIIEQRDALAKAISTASRTLGKTLNETSLRNTNNYVQNCKTFQETVAAYKKNTDNVKREFISVSRDLNAGVTANDLAGTAAVASKKIKQKVSELRSENATVKADITYAKNTLKVSFGAYKPNLSKSWKDAVRKRAAQINTITGERNKFKQLSDAREKTIDKLEKEKAALDSNYKKEKEEVRRLHNILTDNGNIQLPEVRLEPDSPECFKEVRGNVEFVNKEYGFVQIDIGSEYKITQQYGTKRNVIPFPLPAGVIMTVKRGSGENAVVVAKIRIKTVNRKDSIGNVIKGDIAEIKENDKVYFSDEDINSIPAAKR